MPLLNNSVCFVDDPVFNNITPDKKVGNIYRKAREIFQ